MIQTNQISYQLTFYDLLCEAENVYELNASIENLIDSFNIAIQDLCSDMNYDPDDVIHPYV